MPRLHVRVGLQKGLERAWWRSFLNSLAKVDLGDFFQTLFKDSSPARDSTNSYVINRYREREKGTVDLFSSGGKRRNKRPANDDKEGSGRVDETTAVCAYLRVVASMGTAVQPPRR